ncbi:MAG: GAF domain-containing protein, partial [Chloroflexi bacterium]|nr:GAF domain-containing protein [Chloroflexota bacterium]
MTNYTDTTPIDLLSDLGRGLSQSSDLGGRLEHVIETLLSVTGAQLGFAVLIPFRNAPLTIHAQRRLTDPDAVPEAVLRLIQRAVDRSEPILLRSGEFASLEGEPETIEQGWMILPLVQKGRAIGAICLAERFDGRPYSESDMDLALSIAGFGSLAVENQRLYEQAIESTLEICLLVESANAVSSWFDLRGVLQAITSYIIRGLSAHWCTIITLGADGKSMARIAEYRSAYWSRGQGPALAASTQLTHYPVFANGKPSALALQSHRCMLLPLRHLGRPVGVLELGSLKINDVYDRQQVHSAWQAVEDLPDLLAGVGSDRNQSQLIDRARQLLSSSRSDWCSISEWDADAQTLRRRLDYGTAIFVDRQPLDPIARDAMSVNRAMR